MQNRNVRTKPLRGVGDQTYRGALIAFGESPERMGSHDHYEPTVVSRVYFILDAEACQIKIGYTERTVDDRLHEIQERTGRKLELLGSMRGGYDLERAMHGRFRAYRVEKNEWYSSEIIGELAPLLAA